MPPALAIEAATNMMRHRGPDDEGYVLFQDSESNPLQFSGSDSVREIEYPHIRTADAGGALGAFGFRRLSIVDLSAGGHQPMSSEFGDIWIVFNGEIYNHVELRETLMSKGYAFKTQSDTEVALIAYQEWGTCAFTNFIGMFAIAIYDNRERLLILARDQLGIKPLHFTLTSSGFAFASEIKALLKLPNVKAVCNSRALTIYLEQGYTDFNDETFFKDIYQLPPGTYCYVNMVDSEKPYSIIPYYTPTLNVKSSLNHADAAYLIKKELTDSVRLHLRSDVPVGVCLSGGVDSSAIASLMREIQPSMELHAFSYISDDPESREEAFIEKTAQSIQAELHKLTLNEANLSRKIDEFIYQQEQPVRGIGSFAHYCVYEMMSASGIKVSLDGQGADELFAGYNNFISSRLLSLLSQLKLFDSIRFVRAALRRPGINWYKLAEKIAITAAPEAVEKNLWKLYGQKVRKNGLNREWLRENSAAFTSRDIEYKGTPLRKDLYTATMRTILPRLLRGQDRNSSAHSIESRVPFITPRMLEVAFSIPEENLIDLTSVNKVVLRTAMRGCVPSEVLDNKRKVGFGVPEERWLSGLSEWIEGNMDKAFKGDIPCFDKAILKKKWKEMKTGTTPFDYRRVWFWVNVARWVEQYNVSFE